MTTKPPRDADLGYKTPFPRPFEPSFVYAPYISSRVSPTVFTPEDFKPMRQRCYLCPSCMTMRACEYDFTTCCCVNMGTVSGSQALGWI